MPDPAEAAKRISNRVRGFETYRERDARHASDRAMRKFLAERIGLSFRVLSEAARDRTLFPDGERPEQAVLGMLAERLGDAVDALRAVPYEFSDFMTAGDLGDDDLAAFYQRDEQVLHCLSAMQGLIDPTLSPEIPVAAFIEELGRRIEDLISAIGQRQSAISAFSPTSRRDA